MRGFTFTQKKLRSLSEFQRQKWISHWIREIYIEITNHKISLDSLSNFFLDYQQVLSWTGQTTPAPGDLGNEHAWAEFLSDRYHYHWKQTSLGLREEDFLPKIRIGDSKEPQHKGQCLTYKPVLDNFRSAFNVGSILRVVDAVGFEGVIMGPKTPGPGHAQVKKTSMGTEAWVSLEAPQDLAASLADHQLRGYSIIGVETMENSLDYTKYSWPEKGLLLLGNEEYGISPNLLSVCDDFVHLPMTGKKNSINVANAFAVIAYHILTTFRPT